jgi:hypothetical protein
MYYIYNMDNYKYNILYVTTFATLFSSVCYILYLDQELVKVKETTHRKVKRMHRLIHYLHEKMNILEETQNNISNMSSSPFKLNTPKSIHSTNFKENIEEKVFEELTVNVEETNNNTILDYIDSPNKRLLNIDFSLNSEIEDIDKELFDEEYDCDEIKNINKEQINNSSKFSKIYSLFNYYTVG